MNHHTIIIAEAGVNHNGDIQLAKKLIDAAKECDADIIKFQTFKTENLATQYAQKALYQKSNTAEKKDDSQFNMLKKLELSVNDHKELIEYCSIKKIKFLSSPFDINSIDLLIELGLDTFKVPSGEITNLPYLRKIGKLKKNIILSTGMSDLGEVEDALNELASSGTPKQSITLLHCNTDYPTKFSDVNLKAMITLRDAFDVNIGYSDHTLGIEIPIAAVAMGATVIEKHFTLSRQLEGPDHSASLEPSELRQMISSIRNVEMAIGNGIKKPSQNELKNRDAVRKSIVASKNIKKGEIFSESNLTVKRPGNGLSPMTWDSVIGKEASRDYEPDEMI